MKKKLTVEEVLYCREHYKPGDKEFGLKGLAARFSVNMDVIKDLVHGKTYKDVGGTIHPAIERVSAEVKAQIRAEYVPQSSDSNIKTLAAKYNFSIATISHIVKGTSRKVKNEVPDFIKEAIIEACDEEKLTVKALAERFSISRDLVKGVLKEAGIEIRKRVDEETKAEIIAAYKSGQSLRHLEGIYKINRATISGWVKDIKREKPKVELTPEIREQIYRYHSQGYGIGIIGKTLGLSAQIVRRVVDGEL